MSLRTSTTSPTPYVTEHAADQWDARTDPDSVAPETAWAHSQRVVGAERPTRTDECRLHRPTRTLLLRNGYAVVTVLSESEFDPPVERVVEPLLEEVDA